MAEREPSPCPEPAVAVPAASRHDSTSGTSWMELLAPAALPGGSAALPRSPRAVPATRPRARSHPAPGNASLPAWSSPPCAGAPGSSPSSPWPPARLCPAPSPLWPRSAGRARGDPQGFCGGCARGQLNSGRFPSHGLPRPLETLRSPAGHTGTNWGLDFNEATFADVSAGCLPPSQPSPRAMLPPHLLLLGTFPLPAVLAAQRHHPPELLVLTPAASEGWVSGKKHPGQPRRPPHRPPSPELLQRLVSLLQVPLQLGSQLLVLTVQRLTQRLGVNTSSV